MEKTIIQKGIDLIKKSKENINIEDIWKIYYEKNNSIENEFCDTIMHSNKVFNLCLSTIFHNQFKNETKNLGLYEINQRRYILIMLKELPLVYAKIKIETTYETLIQNMEQTLFLRNIFGINQPTWMDIPIWIFAFKINWFQENKLETINRKQLKIN